MWPRTAPHFSESALLSLLLVPRVIFAVRRLYGGQADGYCREFCSKKTWWLRLRAASVVTTVLSPSPKVFVILEFLALCLYIDFIAAFWLTHVTPAKDDSRQKSTFSSQLLGAQL